MADSIHLTRRQLAGAALAAGASLIGARAAAQALREPTPDAAMGPFYPVARPTDADADLTRVRGGSGRASGTVIEVRGRVLDRRGNPISGARLEMWQCNAAGRYAHPNDPATAPLDPNFQGFAALRTRRDGAWRLITIKPAGYDSPIGHRPPHLHWDLAGRGDRRVTQMYFPEDAAANQRDELYQAMGAAAPRAVALRERANLYLWDIVLDEG